MRERHFASGETIFAEGDGSEEAFVIALGRVEVLKGPPESALRLAILGPGDVFGEMGLLDERPRSATIRAIEPVVAQSVGRDEFLHLLLHEPKEAMSLLHALFERLRSANRLLAESAHGGDLAAAFPGSTPQVTIFAPPGILGGVSGATEGVAVTRFPYRVGRVPASEIEAARAFNDLSLADTAPYRVSLNHFALDLGPEGVVLRDRGSRLGVRVNGQRIGGGRGRDDAVLRDGDNEVLLNVELGPFARARDPLALRIAVTGG
jgi:CRP-like cAMP-binding protein